MIIRKSIQTTFGEHFFKRFRRVRECSFFDATSAKREYVILIKISISFGKIEEEFSSDLLLLLMYYPIFI